MADHEGGFPRSSGVLMHITSLPGPYGIGDLGQSSHEFVERLAAARQAYWQVLPLGPTGFGDSPYLCFSSFAGNTRLISLDGLGWLKKYELEDRPLFRKRVVEYERIIPWHDEMLSLAFERFLKDGGKEDDSYTQFCADHKAWLDDYALFAALKDQYGNTPWHQWSPGEALQAGVELRIAQERHSLRMEEHKFRQWLFYDQWTALRERAAKLGIKIIGDMPIYVGHDSCDVWVNRHLFDLDEYGHLRTQTGVPPDYFSATGQLWGHPTYLWTEHAKPDVDSQRYGWWIKRVLASLQLYDVLRIDHFRAFYNYWRIPASAKTAQDGEWLDSPRDGFFDELKKVLSQHGYDLGQTIIAEDLGDRMEKVTEWRLKLGLYGMKILQFAFGDNPDEVRRFLPEYRASPGVKYDRGCVLYAGTHDNATTMGWWYTEGRQKWEKVRQMFQEFLSHSSTGHEDSQEFGDPNWQMIYIGMHAADDLFILSMQDLLGTGETSRMNTPGKSGGLWRWRCSAEELAEAPWKRLKTITEASDRAG